MHVAESRGSRRSKVSKTSREVKILFTFCMGNFGDIWSTYGGLDGHEAILDESVQKMSNCVIKISVYVI